VRAQPIGISAAPNMAGQARGEGERMAGRFDKAQPRPWFPGRPPPASQGRRKKSSRGGEIQETSERLNPTNVAAALSGFRGHFHDRNGKRSGGALEAGPMGKNLYLRIVSAVGFAALAALFVTIDPFLSAGASLTNPNPAISINRSLKGDR